MEDDEWVKISDVMGNVLAAFRRENWTKGNVAGEQASAPPRLGGSAEEKPPLAAVVKEKAGDAGRGASPASACTPGEESGVQG